jgi:transcriptional regulator of heat shock response
MELKYLYPEEIILLGNIIERYEKIQENQLQQAFQLSKDALQICNRFSQIKHDVKKQSSRGQDAATKERLKDICDYLDKVSTHCRMIWKYGKENIKRDEDF